MNVGRIIERILKCALVVVILITAAGMVLTGIMALSRQAQGHF